MIKAYRFNKLFVFILPCLICFAIAFIIPFISGVGLSFFEWKTTIQNAKFTGFNNYVVAFKDQYFIDSFLFTLKFVIVSVFLVNGLAFILALILTSVLPLKNLFRTIIFMPNLIGGVILGYIWQVIINALFYDLNTSIGSNENLGFLGLVLIINWQLVGYMMIIYIAGINNVSKDLTDASKVDGANFLKRVHHVIIPSVMSSITICFFLTLINTFKLFDANLALTNGGPNRRTEMLALNIIHTIFSERLPGVGLAKGFIFFIVIGGLSLMQVKFTRGKEIEN